MCRTKYKDKYTIKKTHEYKRQFIESYNEYILFNPVLLLYFEETLQYRNDKNTFEIKTRFFE